MAKGQKRSNREPRKPKKVKTPEPATPATFMPKGAPLPGAMRSKKA